MLLLKRFYNVIIYTIGGALMLPWIGVVLCPLLLVSIIPYYLITGELIVEHDKAEEIFGWPIMLAEKISFTDIQ
jgi:hypothetical protein